MPIKSQLGVKNEAVYGTAVTVDRFFELRSENIDEDYQRIESQGRRTGEYVLAADRFATGKRSFAGPIEMEWLTKGMGWWLHHMLGTVTTSAVVDSVYTHTAEIAPIGTAAGDSFTAQVNRPFNPSDADQAFTWEGGKITGWEFECAVEQLLVATIDCDFEDVATGTSLETASYASGAELMSFVGGTVTLAAGTVVNTERIRVRCDNGLRTDKYHLGSRTKRQPVENQRRNVEWELELDFDSLTHGWNRVASVVASGALASIVAEFRGPTLAGTATFPSLTVTMANARFDQIDGINDDGEEALMQTLSGVALTPSSDTAIKVAYKSTDSTP